MIGVIGGGAWGTAIASMLATAENDVLLWARNPGVVLEINDKHTNQNYLGDAALAPNLEATTELAGLAGADVLLFVAPAQTFRTLVEKIDRLMTTETKLVLCAKGIDQSTGLFLHEMAEKSLPSGQIAALSGPSFAHDVVRNLPTAVSLAARNLGDAQSLAERLTTSTFRIYASDDLIGVEAGGSLKNVIALAVGIARGLKLGASAEAALIARGFAEMNRLAKVIGVKDETLTGLSGLGDLVLTCASPQSRNFSFGMALSRGDDLSKLPLAEGVATAAMALAKARENDVHAPVVEAVVAVLDRTLTPSDAVTSLLARPLRPE